MSDLQGIVANAQFPIKLQCLFEKSRYKALYGGRGGAKSWGVARVLLIKAAKEPLRILCAREFMTSMRDSVHKLLTDDLDMVAGWSQNRQDGFLLRKLPSRLANALIARMTGLDIKDNGCSLKVFRTSTLRRIRLYGEMHRFIPAWLSTVTSAHRIAQDPVSHHARQFGESKYGISRTLRVVVDLLSMHYFLRFGTRPGHFFGGIGLTVLSLGALLGLIYYHEQSVLPDAARLAAAGHLTGGCKRNESYLEGKIRVRRSVGADLAAVAQALDEIAAALARGDVPAAPTSEAPPIASVDATIATRWQQAVSAIGQQSIWEDRRGADGDGADVGEQHGFAGPVRETTTPGRWRPETYVEIPYPLHPDPVMTSILQPVAPYRNDFSILTGLAHNQANGLGDGGGDHARSAATFLTAHHPRKTSASRQRMEARCGEGARFIQW